MCFCLVTSKAMVCSSAVEAGEAAPSGRPISGGLPGANRLAPTGFSTVCILSLAWIWSKSSQKRWVSVIIHSTEKTRPWGRGGVCDVMRWTAFCWPDCSPPSGRTAESPTSPRLGFSPGGGAERWPWRWVSGICFKAVLGSPSCVFVSQNQEGVRGAFVEP